METQAWLEARLKGQKLPKPAGLITQNEQLWEPLYACYKSLQACGMGIIANGELLDTLRRVKSFGVPLVRIDIRQESTRHTEALGEMTRYLGIGDYESWSEADKQAFLIRELNSKRPLLPRQWEPSEETREVLDTCKVIAEAPRGSIAAYVISMAKTPSDVLAVHLLLKEAGIGFALPVAPLFETLDDLNNANDVMTQLLNIDWYRGFIQGKQMVMIGYSDSAKDAGVMAASWAQYQAQDALIKTCEKAGIELTLFHGRGGSIGRGGAPAHAALLSQPPGSLKGGLRVTEQGEMIRFKYGLPEVTISSLSLYTSAILKPTCCRRRSRKQNGATSWPSCPTCRARCIAATCVKTKISSLTSALRPRSRSWANCRWVRVRQNVVQPAASSRCAPFRGSSPGPRTA